MHFFEHTSSGLGVVIAVEGDGVVAMHGSSGWQDVVESQSHLCFVSSKYKPFWQSLKFKPKPPGAHWKYLLQFHSKVFNLSLSEMQLDPIQPSVD